MTLFTDILTELVSLGYASAYDIDIFKYRFPLSPANCLCIIPMSIKTPDEEQGGDGIDYPGFQLQIRDTNEHTAFTNAEAIRLALNDSVIGEYAVFTTRSTAVSVTNEDDLHTTEGSLYRFAVDFETIQVR